MRMFSKFAVVAAFLVHTPGVWAQCWTETAEVFLPNGIEYDHFGKSTAVQGDVAVASGDNRVRLYQRDLGGPDAWGLLKELSPASPSHPGWGTSVALDGDVIAVGYTHTYFGLGTQVIGEVYLFQRDQGGPDNWGQVAAFSAFDGQTGDYFGDFVALVGSTLVVSAPRAVAPIGGGGVYIYERDLGGPGAWGQIAKLVPNSTSADDFGRVSLSGDTLVIAPRVGPVEIHERNHGGPNNWGQLIGIAPLNDALAVALFGDTLALGTPFEDVGGVSSVGRVRLFARNEGGANTWGQTHLLDAPVPASGLYYGWSIALQGDRMLIGARRDTELAYNAGAAHIRERNEGGADTWGEVMKLGPSAPHANSIFGGDVALDGDTTMVGATSRHTGVPDVEGMTYWPAGNVLLGTTGYATYALVTIDPVSGAASFVGSTAPIGILSLAFDPGSGTLFGTDTDELYTLDVNTGTPRLVGPIGYSTVESLAFDPSTATLYAAAGRQLLELDTKTGAATTIGTPTPWDPYAFGLSFDTVTGTLYAVDRIDNELFIFDTVTGVGSDVGPLGFSTVETLAFDPVSEGLFGADLELDEFLSVDVLTGAASSISVMGVSSAGTVFFHERTTFENYCTAGTSASGCNASIQASGVPSATKANGFTLATAGLEGKKPGFYVYGSNGRQANSWGSGTSFICVVPPRQRGGLREGQGTLGLCDGFATQDLNARWCPTCPKPSHNPGAGAVMQAQFWYRDPLNTSNQTSSFSGAIEFTFCP